MTAVPVAGLTSVLLALVHWCSNLSQPPSLQVDSDMHAACWHNLNICRLDSRLCTRVHKGVLVDGAPFSPCRLPAQQQLSICFLV